MIADFERYRKNTTAFSEEEVRAAHQKSVCVVGCGGLGGHVIQTLARFGVGKLTLVDGDVFTHNNLNRQVFCRENNLGRNKALATKEALRDINSNVEVNARAEMLAEDNMRSIMAGHDIAMDCLDSAPARLLLERACAGAGIPFVHGAISGFFGQVSSVFPGDDTMQLLYGGKTKKKEGETRGNPPFIPQITAAVQCSEALKILVQRGDILRRKLLLIDLFDNTFHTVELE